MDNKEMDDSGADNVDDGMENRVHAWLTVHDPALYTGEHGIHTSSAMDAMSSLASTSGAVTAPSQSAVTGANASSLLTADKNAANALTAAGGNPSDPAFLAAWAQNLAGGCITLSEMARVSAGYQPQTLSNPGATDDKYEAYLVKMGSCPLYILRMSDVLTINRSSSDWNDLIDSIATTFEGIQSSDQSTITKGLKALAQAASSKMSTQQSQSIFVQNAMNLDGNVSLYLYSSKITFMETKDKGYDTKQSTYEIRRVKFDFQTTMWPRYSAAVAAKFTTNVDDWINNNSTSTAGTSPIPALN